MGTTAESKKTLGELTKILVATDAVCDPREAACSSGTPIPKYGSVVELISFLRSVLFPRFAERLQNESELTMQQFCESRLKRTQNVLCQLICESYITAGESPLADPLSLANTFLEQLPEIRNRLLTDMEAAYDGDPACKGTDEVVLCYPGFAAVTIYRLANSLYRMGIPLLPRMMTEWAHGETGIDIHPGATINDFFFIDHGTGVVIGETCIIGQNVKVYQGVTLGALSFPKDSSGQLVRTSKRHPTIEDNVVIYANATVLGGNTTVGHDSVVGSSVWLTRSVAPFTTVMMERPELRIRNDGPEELAPPSDYQI